MKRAKQRYQDFSISQETRDQIEAVKDESVLPNPASLPLAPHPLARRGRVCQITQS